MERDELTSEDQVMDIPEEQTEPAETTEMPMTDTDTFGEKIQPNPAEMTDNGDLVSDKLSSDDLDERVYEE